MNEAQRWHGTRSPSRTITVYSARRGSALEERPRLAWGFDRAACLLWLRPFFSGDERRESARVGMPAGMARFLL